MWKFKTRVKRSPSGRIHAVLDRLPLGKPFYRDRLGIHQSALIHESPFQQLQLLPPSFSPQGCSLWIYSLSLICQYLHGSKGCVITERWRLRAVGCEDVPTVKYIWERSEHSWTLFAVILVDGWADAKMEGWMESDEASGICSLGIHYLLQHTHGSSNPSSTGLFSHWAFSGLREDPPTLPTCKLVPRRFGAVCCTLHPDVHYVHGFADTHLSCNCLATLDTVERNALKSQLLVCTCRYAANALLLYRDPLKVNAFQICFFFVVQTLFFSETQKLCTPSGGWWPWDLLMFAAAVLRIHTRPCGTAGENEALDMLFVKIAKNEQGGWLMQSKGDVHEYVLYANSARRGCWLKLLLKAKNRLPNLQIQRQTCCQCDLLPQPWGPMWWQIPATKVTRVSRLCGPAGCSDSTDICLFYHHLDLLL